MKGRYGKQERPSAAPVGNPGAGGLTAGRSRLGARRTTANVLVALLSAPVTFVLVLALGAAVSDAVSADTGDLAEAMIGVFVAVAVATLASLAGVVGVFRSLTKSGHAAAAPGARPPGVARICANGLLAALAAPFALSWLLLVANQLIPAKVLPGPLWWVTLAVPVAGAVAIAVLTFAVLNRRGDPPAARSWPESQAVVGGAADRPPMRVGALRASLVTLVLLLSPFAFPQGVAEVVSGVREVLRLHQYTTVLDAVSAPGFALLRDTGDGDPHCSYGCTERSRLYDGSAGPETTFQAFAATLTSAGYRCTAGCPAGAGGNGQLTSWRRAGADLGVDLGVDLAVGTAADVADPALGPVAAPDAIIATVTVVPAN